MIRDRYTCELGVLGISSESGHAFIQRIAPDEILPIEWRRRTQSEEIIADVRGMALCVQPIPESDLRLIPFKNGISLRTRTLRPA